MKVTNATVAKAAARSSAITATANRSSFCPTQWRTLNSTFVAAIAMPEMSNALTTPVFSANSPPISVNTTVVIQPSPLE